jgi:hypothetical protein
MKTRTTPIFIAVTALALAGAGTGAQAASAGGTSYVGETSQAEPISLKVNSKRTRVHMLYVDWGASADRCSSHREFHSSTMLGMWGARPPGIRRGRITSRITEDYDNDFGGQTVEQFSLSGRIGRSRASGTLSAKVTERDRTGRVVNRCDTGRISWSAVD